MSFVSSQGGKSKKNTHIIYKEEKPGRSVFGKTSFPVLFALDLELITCYRFNKSWNMIRHFLELDQDSLPIQELNQEHKNQVILT